MCSYVEEFVMFFEFLTLVDKKGGIIYAKSVYRIQGEELLGWGDLLLGI